MNKRQRQKQAKMRFKHIIKMLLRRGAVSYASGYQVRRKFCRLHGWAPHSAMVGCYRCIPASGITKTEAIKAYMRGFKLPKHMKAKEFVAIWLRNTSIT